MKRGQYVLISGAALFIIGMVLAATVLFQITDWFSQGNVFVEDWPLGVGESKTLSLQVTNAAKPLNILIITNPDTKLDVVLTDPNKSNILSSSYSRTSKDIQATLPGTYTLLMTNIGSSPTQLSAALRQPEVTTTAEVNSMVDSMSGTLGAGALVVMIGIIVLIAGVIMTMKDRRKREGLPASSRHN